MNGREEKIWGRGEERKREGKAGMGEGREGGREGGWVGGKLGGRGDER